MAMLSRLPSIVSRRWFACCVVLCLWSMWSIEHVAAAEGPQFNRDGFLMIDGKPRLILGSYEMPADENKLAELARSGFNLVHVSDAAGLDRLKKHGLYGWICVSTAIGENDQAGRDRLTQTANAVKDHPAMLVWELPDEALWNVWYGHQEWACGGQIGALRQEIEKAAAASPEQKTKWRAALARAEDRMYRGLWKESEEITDRLWQELGKTNPQPDANHSGCVAKSVALAQSLARGCQHLRQVDPKHMIWQNHAPRNSLAGLQRFNEVVDAAGCDIYPAPRGEVAGHSDLADQGLTSVGAYTDRMRAGAPGKAVWMVLQGFGWRDINEGTRNAGQGRRPHWHETRFMAYDALAHGANAILYWGTASIEKDSPLWKDMMKIARELRALEPAIVGEHPEGQPKAIAEESFGSIDPDDGPRLLLRKAGDDWVLIAVNERIQPVAFNVTKLPAALEGKTLYRLYSADECQVKDGQFHDGVADYGVGVYATSRRFEAKAE